MNTAHDSLQFKDKLFDMSLGDELQYDNMIYTRVPKGWVVNKIGKSELIFIPE
jgi:hypothetical protein